MNPDYPHMLVKVGEFAFINPYSIDALIQVGTGTVVAFSSGETVTLPQMSPSEVLDDIAESLRKAQVVAVTA